jgi:hypothetical protein
MTAVSTCLIEEVTMTLDDNNILKSYIKCTKRNSANFSTQRSSGGVEFFERILANNNGTGTNVGGSAGSAAIGQNRMEYARNTADITILTSAETVAVATTVNLLARAKVAIGYSGKIKVGTSAGTVTAKTYINSSALTYEPMQTSELIATVNDPKYWLYSYVDATAALTAGDTYFEVKMQSTGAGMIISASQSALVLQFYPDAVPITGADTTPPPYQEWENYPDSPVSLEDYPYQFIASWDYQYISYTNLVYSLNPPGYYDPYPDKITLENMPPYMGYYRLTSGEWVFQAYGLTTIAPDYTYESNFDICDSDSEIIFAKTTT